MKKIKVALLQIETRLGDVWGNTQKIKNYLIQAQQKGAQLAVTPELATLGFGSGDIYLDKVDENLEALEELKELVGTLDIWAIVGFVEKDDLGFFYNSAALLYGGEVKGVYRKVQLVNYRLFDEKRYFAPGRSLPVFKTPFARLGILICEDVWFPEPARAMTFRGAELLVVLSASPYAVGKVELWQDYLRERTYDNLLPIVFANQAGIQDGVAYWGGSMALSARGEILKMGKLLEEDLVIVEIDLDEAKTLRRRDIRVREVRKEILDERNGNKF
jgi:NAD+ synthase (glutamine-hydrolysing)